MGFNSIETSIVSNKIVIKMLYGTEKTMELCFTTANKINYMYIGLFNLTLPVQSPNHSGFSGRISLTVYVILALDHIHDIKLQSAHLVDVPLADAGCCP